jgi:hypothetical protein
VQQTTDRRGRTDPRITGGTALLLFCCLAALACNSSGTPAGRQDGAAGSGGGTAGTDGEAGSGNRGGTTGAGGATSDGGSSRAPCNQNSDCTAPEVCFYSLSSGGCTGAPQRGQCLRMDPTCTTCGCIQGANPCPTSGGGMCLGTSQPNSCWYCYLPV